MRKRCANSMRSSASTAFAPSISTTASASWAAESTGTNTSAKVSWVAKHFATFSTTSALPVSRCTWKRQRGQRTVDRSMQRTWQLCADSPIEWRSRRATVRTVRLNQFPAIGARFRGPTVRLFGGIKDWPMQESGSRPFFGTVEMIGRRGNLRSVHFANGFEDVDDESRLSPVAPKRFGGLRRCLAWLFARRLRLDSQASFLGPAGRQKLARRGQFAHGSDSGE